MAQNPFESRLTDPITALHERSYAALLILSVVAKHMPKEQRQAVVKEVAGILPTMPDENRGGAGGEYINAFIEIVEDETGDAVRLPPRPLK